MKKFILFLLSILIIGAAVTYFVTTYTYSKGFREGYVTKFSEKGYVFKTHEGILKTGFVNLGNTMTPNEEWPFSVKDAAVANQLETAGERKFLKLYYKQKMVQLSWLGDTKYFVYKVEEAEGK